jgi:hypothetical protein
LAGSLAAILGVVSIEALCRLVHGVQIHLKALCRLVHDSRDIVATGHGRRTSSNIKSNKLFLLRAQQGFVEIKLF